MKGSVSKKKVLVYFLRQGKFRGKKIAQSSNKVEFFN